jgi:MFS family permease
VLLAARDLARQHDPQRRAADAAGDLDASSSQLQWIVDAYMLVFAGVLLTAGALGDRFGRKQALAFGSPSSASARPLGLADSPEMLIATAR